MTVRKGTYVLCMTLGADITLDVGALGETSFPKGLYCYVGSALGGLDQRVSRHISKDKSIRWHIDRLTVSADSVDAFESYPDYVPECMLAHMAEEAGMMPVVEGFGWSDCRCRTHLFKSDVRSLERLCADAGLQPFRDSRASE